MPFAFIPVSYLVNPCLSQETPLLKSLYKTTPQQNINAWRWGMNGDERIVNGL